MLTQLMLKHRVLKSVADFSIHLPQSLFQKHYGNMTNASFHSLNGSLSSLVFINSFSNRHAAQWF